jgi:hypothetical protein
MIPETTDKTFNKVMKIIAWAFGAATTIISVTYAIAIFLTNKIDKTVKTSVQLAVAELIYEMKEFKEVKVSVQNHEKTLSLLSYRIGVMEGERQIRSHISKEFEKPEETAPVTISNDKKRDS